MANLKNKRPKDENGKRHGEWILYHDNRKLMYRWNYVHGVAHGLDEGYYADGRLAYRGCWNMNKKINYWCYENRKEFYLFLV